jgi:hypothetical protein
MSVQKQNREAKVFLRTHFSDFNASSVIKIRDFPINRSRARAVRIFKLRVLFVHLVSV